MPTDTIITFEELRYLTIPYYDYNGHTQTGEMVCNKVIAKDLLKIFRALFSAHYQIYSIKLIDEFDASDETSMQANNTSCFNYRVVFGTNELSTHAYGMAVDINPLQNPCVRNQQVQPKNARNYVERTEYFKHKIDDEDFCYQVFTSFGFKWGGNWKSVKDYQHFEKR